MNALIKALTTLSLVFSNRRDLEFMIGPLDILALEENLSDLNVIMSLLTQ